jgi:hypothetical protein
MKQILDIFKKDVRRHWPEILISLMFLALYTRSALKGPSNRAIGSSFAWWILRGESVTPLMIIFWIFLTIRVVQGESLVGDRQWWVTKPYDWWKLLAAKELFLAAFIGTPLFFLQLFLLRHSGFPILQNLFGVLGMLFALGIALFLPTVSLSTLTRGLGQALIGILLSFFAFWASFMLIDKIPSNEMSSVVTSSGAISALAVLVGIASAACWQYARRKTWAARGLVVVSVVIAMSVDAMTPYARLVETKFAFAESAKAPAHFTFGTPKPNYKKQDARLDSESNVYLRLPLRTSGIPEGRVVLLKGISVVIEASNGAMLDRGWKSHWTRAWKEDQEEIILFELQKKDFEKLNREVVKLHVELALTEFQENEARELVLKEGEFEDVKLGICSIDERNPSQIDCRRPFHQPGFMATFDPAGQTCPSQTDENSPPEDRVTHDWSTPPGEDSFDPGVNPVTNYQLTFGSPSRWSLPGNGRIAKTVRLCPGTRIRIAEPKEVRNVRVKLEMENVHLNDLAGPQYDWE